MEAECSLVRAESDRYLLKTSQQQTWNGTEPALQLLLTPLVRSSPLLPYAESPEYISPNHCRLCRAELSSSTPVSALSQSARQSCDEGVRANASGCSAPLASVSRVDVPEDHCAGEPICLYHMNSKHTCGKKNITLLATHTARRFYAAPWPNGHNPYRHRSSAAVWQLSSKRSATRTT